MQARRPSTATAHGSGPISFFGSLTSPSGQNYVEQMFKPERKMSYK
jgi:hypothetical protein